MFISISYWTVQYVYLATGVMLECFKLFFCTECTMYRIVFMVTDCHCHVMSQWTAAVHIGKQQTEHIVNIVSLQNVFERMYSGTHAPVMFIGNAETVHYYFTNMQQWLIWLHTFQMTSTLEWYNQIYFKCLIKITAVVNLLALLLCSEKSVKTSIWVEQRLLKAPTHILKAAPPRVLNRFKSAVCSLSVSAIASAFIENSFMEILRFEHCQTLGLRQRIIWVNSKQLGPMFYKTLQFVHGPTRTAKSRIRTRVTGIGGGCTNKLLVCLLKPGEWSLPAQLFTSWPLLHIEPLIRRL